MKEYERQKKIEDNEEADNNALIEQKKLQRFINTEQNITTTDTNTSNHFGNYKNYKFTKQIFYLSGKPGTSAISNMTHGRDKELPSFWVPSQCPSAKASKLVKPDPTILCPISQQPMKMKDLIDVKFTLVKDPDDKKSLIVKENRYMCCVTHDILSNSVPCAVIRTT